MSVSEYRIFDIWQQAMEPVKNWSLVLDYEDLHIRHNAERTFSGASMIKSFILECIRIACKEGRLSWEDVLVCDDEVITGGDGLIQHWRCGLQLSLYQVCSLMIALSDNSATNLAIRHFGGTEAINDQLDALGYRASHLRRWVGGKHPDARSVHWHADKCLVNEAHLSCVQPLEHARVVQSLINDEVCRSFLLSQQDVRSLARLLPDSLQFAHKTGTVDGVRHDGGVLFLPDGRYIHIHCFTDDRERLESTDDRACLAMANACAATFDLLCER